MLIETRNSAEPLARTLSGLVGGAIEGIVRDVVILDHGSTDQTHKVADAAGCTFIRDHGLIECIRHARGDWLLILEPGARLLEGWMEGIATHVEHFPGPARFTRAGTGPKRFLSRVFARCGLCRRAADFPPPGRIPVEPGSLDLRPRTRVVGPAPSRGDRTGTEALERFHFSLNRGIALSP